jgi:hypothetical protein
MNRISKWVVLSCIAGMTLVALAVTAYRWDALIHLDSLSDQGRRRVLVGTAGLYFCPAWLAVGSALIRRRLASEGGLRMPLDRRRHVELTWIASAMLVAGMQAWLALGAILGAPPGRAMGLRLVFILTGVFFAVTANFAAKTSPPPGIDAGAYTRSILRTSWIGVCAGLAIVIGSVLVDLRFLLPLQLGATLAYLAAAVVHRRTIRSCAGI